MIQSEKKLNRQIKILSRLASMQYATRKQLQIIENLGGDRNAHRILHDMEKEKLIQSMRKEQKIYSLSNKGKELIGFTQKELTGRMVEHSLMRNDLYIQLKMPSDWQIEVPLKLKGEEPIICDAMFMRRGEYHFVEIDVSQSMNNNYEKIEKYIRFNKGVFHQYGHMPTIIYYTKTEQRKSKLEEYMKRKGVKGEVYVK